jgi:hypothetical protein
MRECERHNYNPYAKASHAKLIYTSSHTEIGVGIELLCKIACLEMSAATRYSWALHRTANEIGDTETYSHYHNTFNDVQRNVDYLLIYNWNNVERPSMTQGCVMLLRQSFSSYRKTNWAPGATSSRCA